MVHWSAHQLVAQRPEFIHCHYVISMPMSVAGQDPARELVVVANVANNPLAFLNDPLGTGHAANVIDVLAWDAEKKELHILIFAGMDTMTDACIIDPSFLLISPAC